MSRSFNTTTDAIVPGSSVTDLTGNWTVGGWFQRASTGAFIFPMWNRWTSSASQRQLLIYMAPPGNTDKLQVDVPFVSVIFFSSATITDSNWHSVVVTRSGNNWVLYIDGASNQTTSNAAAQETGASLNIGHDPVDTRSFGGNLAEWFGSTTVWTAGEVSAFNAGALPYTIRGGSGLVGYWPLDGLQSPEPDLSGNAHNGTLTGTALAAGPPVMPFTPRWGRFVGWTPMLPASGLGWIINRRNKLMVPKKRA